MEKIKFELTNKENYIFFNSLNALGGLKMNDLTVLMTIVKAKRMSKEHYDKYETLGKEIVEENCNKDENGEPIKENNNYRYKDTKTAKEVINKLDELDEQKIQFHLTPISLVSLHGVNGLTANIIEGLFDLILE